MKRSEAIKLVRSELLKFEILSQEKWDSGWYDYRAEEMLKFIETKLKMEPEKVPVKRAVHEFSWTEWKNEWED